MSEPARPRCYNRPPTPVGRWCRAGFNGVKPIWRFVWFRMSIDCGSHKTFGGLQEVDPIRYNWNCAGCRWHPDVTGPEPLFHNFNDEATYAQV